MVRESGLVKKYRKQKAEGRQTGNFLFSGFFFLLPAFCLLLSAFSLPSAHSAIPEVDKKLEKFQKTPESGSKKANTVHTQEGDKKVLILKVMVVNPSKKNKQIFPMKAYLPEEIQPEHILGKEDLEVGYDSEKKAYYMTKQIELDPGQAIVKTIKVEDIWQVPEEQLHEMSDEAGGLFKKVVGTLYEAKARLLLSNMEVLLTQIYELQNDTSLTPEEHISSFRDNKKKLREIELDLVALRRLVFQSTGEGAASLGLGSQKQVSEAGASQGFMGANFTPESVSKENKGSLPEWVAWRAIFIILGFLALGATSFYLIWHRQLRVLEKRKKQESEQNRPRSVFEDVLGGSSMDPSRLDEKIVIPTARIPPQFPNQRGRVA